MNWEADWLASRRRVSPAGIALIDADGGGRYTYERLDDRASRLAAALRDAGVGRGDRVALLSPNDVAYFDYMFACAKLGALFVPLNYRLSEAELAYIVNDCAPKAIGYAGVHEPTVAAWPIPDRRRVDDAAYARLLDDNSAPRRDSEPVDWAEPWLLIYTGGTTGKPKGVLISHRAVWWNAVNTIVSWGLSDADVTLNCMPMFHTGGINALTLPVLLAGGTVVLGKQFDPVLTVDWLIQYRCTNVLLVPTMYHLVVQTEQFRAGAFPPNLVFISGGAPCPLSIYDAFAARGLKFKEGYGMTEAGPNNFVIAPEEAMRRRGSVGQPMLLNKVRIVTGSGEDARPNEVGEIWLQGHHLFNGYWNDEAATLEAMRDGWLRTGDLAKRDEDGFVYIMGRLKDMIISGGENIYPIEIEQALLSAPAVKEAAVVGVADPKWGEAVVAAVVMHEGQRATPEQLRAHCAERLGRYKVPKRIVVWDRLPKTPVGKINKQAIVNML
ncbi:long-chain fatty acid--CoA ligase [Paenibacillus sp.]|uniref:acyl-CoA synthetase n=1 Tax=Paenibacillus sp. TaxID=58172 RepID=UPI002D5B120C|nr:long-chain fatty acid--CoA ligase [Paenibacillus sp.]HZG87794.1 long-chain fatty acid--CoA ligase [Paenibacillus sp.]